MSARDGRPGDGAIAVAVLAFLPSVAIGAGIILVAAALVGLTAPIVAPIAWALSAAGVATLDVLAYRALCADADARAEALRAARSS